MSFLLLSRRATNHALSQDVTRTNDALNALRADPAARPAAVEAMDAAMRAAVAAFNAFQDACQDAPEPVQAERPATIAPALWDAYRLQRGHKLTRRDDTARTASTALSFARIEAARGWTRGPGRPLPLSHGDVIRSRTPQGERRTYAVAIIPDTDHGAPWIEHDGHGEIREVTFPRGSHVAKRPGEVVFASDGRYGCAYAYDVPATIAKARAEGWGLGPEGLANLERRTGRKPTRKMEIAEAVRLDLERCAGWVRDEWSWIGVALIRMDRTGETAGGYATAEAAADAWAQGLRFAPGSLAASLWGIESDSGADYLASVALELVSEANAT